MVAEKTTLLHIIANALEFDFERFESLVFKRIRITTFRGSNIDLHQNSEGKVHIIINGSAVVMGEDWIPLLTPGLMTLREELGSRPAYLPAFRSVLERARSDTLTPYRESGRDGEVEELIQKEFAILRGITPGRDRESAETRALREEATVTARKTIQCRNWFGSFVPIIRYPSILDVDDGLSNEWRSAQLKLAQREQDMFADVFAKVFRTVVGIDSGTTSEESEENLLTSISRFLSQTDLQTGVLGPNPIYGQLREATEFLKSKNERGSNEIARSVLQLYMQTLSDRNDARTKAFQNSRDFELSINRFLDKKKLRIGGNISRARFRSSVTIGVDGGRSYGLGALSSGEKQILTMLYSASRSRFPGGMFLIDEPELSLHVDWQRIILAELIAVSPKSQIIACTHSPEVGADHLNRTQDFEPVLSKDRVLASDLFDDFENLEE